MGLGGKGEPSVTTDAIISAIKRAYQVRLKRAEDILIEQTKIVEMVRSERLDAIELIVRTVCHEVNNPLSGVVALSQLLRQHDKLDGELHRLVDGIVESAQEVADVVRKLHSISDHVIEFGGHSILDIDQSPTALLNQFDATNGDYNEEAE